jgi:antitoxin (DNA-binding transcriptional repressor) of toxin-antitoxin stability system
LIVIHVPIAQAKNQLSELIGRVELGETFAVTRRGKPVAKLEAWALDEPARQGLDVRETFARLSAMRCDLELGGDLKAISRLGLDG